MNADTSSKSDSTSWEHLLKSIKDSLKSENFDKSHVFKTLLEYQSKEEDWSVYTFFDDNCYSRNLVDSGNGLFNLMILSWNPAQGSCIHNHSNASCFVKVLAGAIREIRYDYPEGGDFTKIGDLLHQRDDVTLIEDQMGIHEMKNDTANQTVTLHLYTPPFDTCNRYSRETGETSACVMSYKSVYGNLIQKDLRFDERADPCC